MATAIRRRDRIGDALFRGSVGLLLAACAVFLLAPLFVVVVLSFDGRSYLGAFPPTSLSLQWYRRFFQTPLYVDGLWTSIRVSLLSVSISVTTGVAASIGLHYARFFGRDLLLAFFLAPLVVPAVVVGSSLLLFLGSIDVTNGLVRLVAGHVLITLPYCIRTTLASLRGLPPSFNEVAMSLGARPRSAFWTVTFPLIKRGIVAGGIFGLAMSLDDVTVSLFLVEPPYYTLPVALLTEMRANFDLTIAAVGAMLSVITASLIFILDRVVGMDRLFGRGVYRTN